MDLGSLLGTVMKESLGMRPKRHDSATRWILKGVRKRPGLALGAAVGAAGLAYGLWERSQRPGSGSGAPAPMPGPQGPPPFPQGAAPFPQGAPGAPAPAGRGFATPPPLPAMGASTMPAPAMEAPVPADAAQEGASLRQARLVLAAAQADGAVTAAEMQRVMEAARHAGAGSSVLEDLATPRDVEAIVSGVTDPTEREDLYALAFAVVRCDEAVSDAERRWLERLAAALGLSPRQVAAIEAEVAAAIDAPG